MLSLLRYSYSNRRSTALVVYSVLAAIWTLGWLVVWTVSIVYIEPDGDGGPVGFFAAFCAWSVLIVGFCGVPLMIQIAWAMRVQKQEAEEAARAGGNYYPPPYPPAYRTGQSAGYPPTAAGGWHPPPPAPAVMAAPDARLEEEKRRTRDLEYENALLRRRLRDEEARRRATPTAERLVEAQGLEMERRYEDAAKAYEELDLWDDAARVRMLQGKGGPF
jgi:hypothetical protein